MQASWIFTVRCLWKCVCACVLVCVCMYVCKCVVPNFHITLQLCLDLAEKPHILFELFIHLYICPCIHPSALLFIYPVINVSMATLYLFSARRTVCINRHCKRRDSEVSLSQSNAHNRTRLDTIGRLLERPLTKIKVHNESDLETVEQPFFFFF